MSESPTLAVRGLTVTRPGGNGLRDVSFEVFPGDVLAVAGGPGSGKTTLLRSVLGLVPIVSGSVRYDGDPTAAAGLTSVVGFVPSEAELHPGRTVHSHLRIVASRFRDASLRVELVSRQTRITGVLGKQARDLTPPEALAVSLATALLARPQVLLIDEPKSGGHIVDVLAPVISGFAGAGGTVVVAARGLSDLAPLATQATVLRQGKQTFITTMSDITTSLSSNVLVATATPKRLALALAATGITDATIRRDGYLRVVGCTVDQLTDIADRAAVQVHHVTPEFANLETMYGAAAGGPAIPWGFGAVVLSGGHR